MRVKDFIDVLYSPVEILRDSGNCSFETLFQGEIKEAPVRVLGMFVGHMWTKPYNDIISILTVEIPFE